MTPSCFVFDIETLPKVVTPELADLLNHKVRKVAKEKYEEEKIRYSFISPVYAKVFSIATLYDTGDGVPVKYSFFNKEDEETLLRDFVSYLSQWHDKYVHYNGLDFDVVFILFKCMQYGIELPTKFCNLIRFRFEPHFDIMQALSSWGKFPISLAEALTVFGLQNSKDALNGLDTLSFLQTATDQQILHYNEEDVKGTYELYKRIYQFY